jgi:hypothetical protein
MAENIKRGYVPTDARDFSQESIKTLRRASSDVLAIIDRGYPIKSVSTFVGNHYQLSERQRVAIARAVSPTDDVNRRLSKLKTSCTGEHVYLDGLNVIITLETMLSETTLIKCMDGTLRDLCGLRGTYRLIDKTDVAIKLLGEELTSLEVSGATFYLDSPVSNTGRLSQRIHEILDSHPFTVTTELVPNADVILETKENVITSDAIILNKCVSWLNPVLNIMHKRYPNTPVIDFI